MRLVFNLRDQDWHTTKSLGVLNVSTRLLSGLVELPGIERIDVLANRSLTSVLPLSDATKRVCRWHFASEPAPRGWARLWWDNASLVRTCDALAPDWLLLPKGFSPLLRWPRARVSAFVHDNIFGYYRRRGLRPFPFGQARLFDLMLRRTARRAELIVTNSQATAEEFRRDFAPRGRMARVGAPIGPVRTSESIIGKPSLLLPTSNWPHKLTAQAITWVGQWADATGFRGAVHGYGTLPGGCRWPDREGWKHHGRMDDETLATLHDSASTLIYFSDYEGYGLPPVESAAAGRRAIASNLPALRETMAPVCLFENTAYASFHETLSRALASSPQKPIIAESAVDVAKRWLSELRAS